MTSASEHIHHLEGDVGVKVATAVADALRQALQDHATVLVDTQAVTHADLTTVQTLLSAQRFAAQENKSVALARPVSEPVLAALRSTGLLAPDQADLAFWPLNPEQM